MSSSTPKATINALSAMPDGKASVKQWSDQITQILHALLATLPPPPSGTGAFSGWLKSCLTPACTGQAAVLKKFMPQTLFHKVQHFYGKENGTPKKVSICKSFELNAPSQLRTPLARNQRRLNAKCHCSI
jgi:hypothetical protein